MIIHLQPFTCEVLLRDVKRMTKLMLMLGFNEAMDQLAIVDSVCWYGHDLRRILVFKVEGHGKKSRAKRTWKKLVEEESVKVGLSR